MTPAAACTAEVTDQRLGTALIRRTVAGHELRHALQVNDR